MLSLPDVACFNAVKMTLKCNTVYTGPFFTQVLSLDLVKQYEQKCHTDFVIMSH